MLSDVSLALPQGQFIGLLGPNGAGKTTLMRAILGLIRPRKGQITVLGKPCTRGNPDIGYMPQLRAATANLRLCGRDFVASASHGRHWGLPILNKAARLEIDWALERVSGQSLARRPLAELSGGERQRLLLAQALLGRPRLLLLDEPLASLDPHHQHSVISLVREVQQQLGMTVLLSAHELNPLLHAIDQVLYLGNGMAALGMVDQVITSTVLSRLYGAPIEVQKIKQRYFVMSGEFDLGKEEHRPDA